ncbi:hypothetical protein H696_03422 [Fonticula alba]|uniref:Rhodanese domain-containing protein n=1 Tax=Fonticula alba TaxID=691883 RepID=A0A058Z8Y1_FONAL|nr:hypothetical protein H696_03422 [Fonticula alba]KCV69957.1 hypothetical protein H696_03422 [Fonticula alba]|eukprot:XP_009495563.1 hypothetical protein H696_03422 [Fonticula alba]
MSSPISPLIIAGISLAAAGIAYATHRNSASIIMSNNVRTLSVAECKKILDAPGRATKLVDVRAQHEWAAGHLPYPDNVNIPHTQVGQRFPGEVTNNRSAEVILYCAAGGRSGMAANTLADMGYTNVINMQGGITAWNNAGFPTEK